MLRGDNLFHAVLQTGNAAFRLLDNVEAVSKLDLCFLDILMPGMSGIEVLQRLKVKPACPIIATTGSVEASSVADMQYVGQGHVRRS